MILELMVVCVCFDRSVAQSKHVFHEMETKWTNNMGPRFGDLNKTQKIFQIQKIISGLRSSETSDFLTFVI